MAFIREQRQKRRTWKEIAECLAVEKDCRITLQGLYQFYRRYVKRQGKHCWEGQCRALPVPSLRRAFKIASRVEIARRIFP